MNVRGGWALIQSSWASWMQYRSFFFILAFGWMIPPLAALFAWSAAAGEGAVAGLTHREFVAYYLVLVLVNQLTYAQSNWTVGDVIREGSLNPWLLRPMAPIFNVTASEVAGKVVTLAFVIPVVGVLALVLKPELHPAAGSVGLFLISLALAWALRFLWGFWLALLAFWTARADALLAVQDALVFLLSGVAAPVALLPPAMQALARILPFRYMVGFPVEILIQNPAGTELWAGLASQLAWLALAALLSWAMWRFGLRRYTAIGG